jgi:hypothetical protein
MEYAYVHVEQTMEECFVTEQQISKDKAFWRQDSWSTYINKWSIVWQFSRNLFYQFYIIIA